MNNSQSFLTNTLRNLLRHPLLCGHALHGPVGKVSSAELKTIGTLISEIVSLLTDSLVINTWLSQVHRFSQSPLLQEPVVVVVDMAALSAMSSIFRFNGLDTY